MVFLSDIS